VVRLAEHDEVVAVDGFAGGGLVIEPLAAGASQHRGVGPNQSLAHQITTRPDHLDGGAGVEVAGNLNAANR
jgi:hypothetical protein